MTAWFIATRRFSPIDRPTDWTRYCAFARLAQIVEVVSLDCLLCPSLLPDIKPAYWPHIVHEDCALQFFTDCDFLLHEVRGIGRRNLLCVFRDPPEHPAAPAGRDWRFAGYDLMDRYGGQSALTNCGGFPLAFADAELSPLGLLDSHARAGAVQQALRAHYPHEAHADARVWALFRLAEAGAG